MKPFSYLLILCGFIYINTQAQISRSQIIANAEPYETLQWTASSANIWSNVQCGGKNILSPTWLSTGTNYSMPYCWGGNSSTSGFLTGISNGRSAGDICASSCGYLFGAEPNCSVGVDCSGFVCRAWGRTDHVSTSQLHNISTQLSSFSDLQVGDIVNYAGSHARLVHTLNANGTWEMIESSGSYDKVHYRTYSYSDLSTNYLPRIYDNIIGGGGSQQQQAPSNDNCPGTPIVSNGSCLTGSVSGASGSYGSNTCSGCGCASPDDNDVYYSFTAAATSHTVTVSNYASNFDAVIELRTACAFGPSNFLSCYDPTGAPNSVSNTWNGLTVGQTYYVRIFEYNSTGTPPNSPNFQVCVTHTCVAPNQPSSISGSVNVCAGSSQTYSINSVSGATSYSWSYSGGGTPNGTGTSVSFNPSSSGTLSVFASNSCGTSSTQTISINVDSGPSQPGSISGDSQVCTGASETYSINSVSGATGYTWAYSGNGNPSGSGTTVSLSPSSSGILSVYATGSCANSPTTTLSITVNPIPNVTISPINPTVCQGGSTTLTASGTGTFNWSNGGSSSQNTVNSAGTYSVTVTSNGCTATASATVTQSNSLNITINASPSSICAGVSASLTASGANTYSWSNGANGSNITVNTSGTYSVTGTNSAGCTGTASTTISQSNGPNVSITANPANIQPGSSSVLSVSPSNATNYQWSPSGISGSNPTVSPTASTTYTVTVTDANGCTGTGTAVITVTNCVFTLTPPTTLSFAASGGNASAQLQATGPAPCTWTSNSCTWATLNPSNGTGDQTISINIDANPDTTSRTCTVTIGGESFTITQAGVSANPCATTTDKPEIVINSCELAATSSLGATYQWYKGSTPIMPFNQQYLNVCIAETETGFYTVVITDANGCVSPPSDPVSLTSSDCICTGINEKFSLATNISIYPNPSTGLYTISLSGEMPTGEFEINIYNMLGQLLSNSMYNAFGSPAWQTEIDLSSQPDGVYLLEVSTKESGNAPVKLIKH